MLGFKPFGGQDAFREQLMATAAAIGADPVDLATVLSYETGGTFDPMQAGPTTQWGQHRGLIQFGEPQAQRYGADFSSPEAAAASQFGPDGAIANYFRSNGYEPGMGLMDLYSTVNAGAPGLYDRTDANNGGAPGTVADKVNDQMPGHRTKALRVLGFGSDYQPGQAFPTAENTPVSMGDGALSTSDALGGLGAMLQQMNEPAQAPQIQPRQVQPYQPVKRDPSAALLRFFETMR